MNEFLLRASDELKQHLIGSWRIWARLPQRPTLDAWTNWLLLGGRGAGKTRAGAEWAQGMALGDLFFTQRPVAQIALVGETYAAAREVMVEGQSGILSLYHKGDRPVWTSSRRRLEWPNGSVAQVFSSEDPEALRGPQFGGAWCASKTIWGSIVAVLAVVASVFGFDVDENSQSSIVEAALQIVGVAGSLFAVLGRLNATSVIE